MNKYLRRGILFIILSIIFVSFGYKLMDEQVNFYKILMTLGVICFGIGFITIIYRLTRKIDRKSLIEGRKQKK